METNTDQPTNEQAAAEQASAEQAPIEQAPNEQGGTRKRFHGFSDARKRDVNLEQFFRHHFFRPLRGSGNGVLRRATLKARPLLASTATTR